MTTLEARDIVWNYLRMSDAMPQRVDLAIVLGSRDDRVAGYAADILQDSSVGSVIITGGAAHQDDLLRPGRWHERSEAAHFATVMRAHGYENELVLEENATNTGENIRLSADIVQRDSLLAQSIVVFTKPYMMRRSLRTFERQWPFPYTTINVASWPCTFDDYVDEDQPADTVINIMVGDLQRIIEYPTRGFMTPSEVPVQVSQALKVLTDAGYTKHIL